MVKVYGPMMSLDASGTIGKCITFSKWKGRNYVRERVIPSNPKSPAQTGRRGMFKFLSQGWAGLGAVNKATWDDLADQIVCPNFNAYVKEGMTGWHNFLSPSQDTPATRVGTPSDNDITAAVWEENRIKITVAGTALGDSWGKVLFASLGAVFTPSVGNGILVVYDTTIASHDIFWTPPSVAVWFINIMTFSDDGVLSAAGTEATATPA